ncbi:MAG: outer membrane protein transport protein [Chromatiaceae bacterium]|nr:outer membrane protein transport protein [Chromatiaceae bacterium]
MSQFDNYKGLFAEEGDFDIPAIFQLGISYRLVPSTTLVTDYQHIGYGDIKSLANPNDEALNSASPTDPNWMGNPGGIGGGWKKANIFKLGIEWKYSGRLALRAGYSKANQIIPKSQTLINIVSPVVNDEHYTLGTGYALDNESQLHFVLRYAPKVTISGYAPNTGGKNGQQGDIYMEQTDFVISYSNSF